jgi:transposase
VPGRQQREWRELTRRRTHLQGDRNRVINRIRRVLETVNVKLGSVISNVVGKTGLAILRDLAAGQSDAERLASHMFGRLKCTRAQMIASLRGRFTEHFRWELKHLLAQLDFWTARWPSMKRASAKAWPSTRTYWRGCVPSPPWI